MSNVRLFNDNCFNILEQLVKEEQKFQLIFSDLPYNETGNKWDKQLGDYKTLFSILEHLVTDDGALIFTGTFKHGVNLYNACPRLYKYEWVWVKENGTNIPSVNYQPFRTHEYIYVYGKGRVSNGKRTPMKYHPQKTKAEPYTQWKGQTGGENYKGGLGRVKTINKGERHPHTVQYFNRDRGYHPTQKPVKLMEYLLMTYTDEGDNVLDFCMGSGSMGVACRNLNRNFVGVELEKEYYDIAVERCKDEQKRL